jgi:hypothetical protein
MTRKSSRVRRRKRTSDPEGKLYREASSYRIPVSHPAPYASREAFIPCMQMKRGWREMDHPVDDPSG